MSANDQILDAAIRHAIYSERYGRGLAKKIVKLLNDADSDLSDQLQKRLERIAINGVDTGPQTTRRLKEVMDALRGMNDRVYKRLLTTLQTELVDMAEFEMENQVATLSRTLPVTIVSAPPTPAYLNTLVTTTPIDGILLKPWVDGMAEGRLERVQRALTLGMVEGQTVDQLVRRIRGSRANGYKDGILEISRRSATTLALTANSTIANAAREKVYRDNARLIQKLKWVSTLDSRTSPTCQSRDGKLYDLDQPHPTPPAHPRCRSLMIPVTVPFSELGLDASDYSAAKRASMDGQVPGDTTYEKWLRSGPKERVVEIYGKERAELFLSGQVKFDDLYKQDGSFYSLAELRQRSGVAPKATPSAKAPEATAPKAPTLAEINAKHDAELKSYMLTKGRKDGKEHLGAFDAATGEMFEKVTDGKKSSVSFPPWLLTELKKPERQLILHHNHPSSNSFSPADLAIIHQFPGAKGIWAHGHNGSSYYAEKGPRQMTTQGYKGLQRMVQQWIQSKVNSKNIAADDANLVFYHVVSMLADHRGYLKYSATLEGPSLEAFNRTKPQIEAFLSTIAGHTA